MPFPTLLARGSAALVVPLLTASAVAGELPQVQFDTGHAAACRMVSGDDVPAAGPGEKIVEAALRVSMLRETPGTDGRLEHVLVEITSPGRRLRVVQLDPQTELITEYEGPIAREETTTRSKSFDAGVHGEIDDLGGVIDMEVKPSIGAGASRAETIKETVRRLPPKIAQLTAGTVNGGHGAFFKLTPTSQSILEGQRTFTCRFAVPADWRADWAVVRCRALGSRDDLFGSERIELCGAAEFYVGLYLGDDAEAKTAADVLARVSATPLPTPTPNGPLGALRGAGRWLCAKPVADSRSDELQRALARLEGLSGQ